jgi:type II secretory pathway pseudopilin PulG
MLSVSCGRLSLAWQLHHFGFLTALTGWIANPALNEETALYKSAPSSRTRRRRIAGFSMVELAVSMTVLLILTAIAIPSLLRSFRTYQLNDSAARLSDILKFTRFEAVRLNTTVPLQIQQFGNDWSVWADSDRDGILDPTEKQILITGVVTLLPSGTPPSAASILAKLGATSSLDASKSGAAGVSSLTFDARGAVSPLAAYVFYLGSPNSPEFGYRAVILLPSGATQIWTAPAGGPWQRLS